jgi:hypothetical protein
MINIVVVKWKVDCNSDTGEGGSVETPRNQRGLQKECGGKNILLGGGERASIHFGSDTV